ncbi:hypothetical protein [Undibacterium sp. Ren11W]|uniref:hypothetical protein n=1 Tax=Undibacterium sp. Ren11W TaxID=3413045 RepID=UPI003BF2EDE2
MLEEAHEICALARVTLKFPAKHSVIQTYDFYAELGIIDKIKTLVRLLTLRISVNYRLKRLWPLPLLIAGCFVSYWFWPKTIGVICTVFTVFLFFPLLLISLIDVWRAAQFKRQPAFFEMNTTSSGSRFPSPVANAFDRIVAIIIDLDSLGFIITMIAGLGLCGYVMFTWFLHLIRHAQYLSASSIAVFGAIIITAAVARIPSALIVLFGATTICGTAFLMGYGNTLLP